MPFHLQSDGSCPWVRATADCLVLLGQSCSLCTYPRAWKAKQFALSTLGTIWGEQPASTEVSPLLPASSETILHPGGGQKTQVWSFQNLACELLVCSILGVLKPLSCFWLRIWTIFFFPTQVDLHQITVLWRTGAQSTQYLELMEGSNEFDETREAII